MGTTALYLIASAAMWLGLGYVIVVEPLRRRTVPPAEERPISLEVVKAEREERNGMGPTSMLEGTKKLDAVSGRNLAERRFFALAAAVRQHEASTKRQMPDIRPADTALYRRLRQICGKTTEAERVA